MLNKYIYMHYNNTKLNTRQNKNVNQQKNNNHKKAEKVPLHNFSH